MKKEWLFASGNAHKLVEVQAYLGSRVVLSGLQDSGCPLNLPETSDTLEGNAIQKARFVFEQTGRNCFADDTGLEVDALHGAPGVYSGRYAGEPSNDQANRKKLLKEMENHLTRSARFRTVICLIDNGKEYLFEGKVEGSVLREERGGAGFGYDSLFVPEGVSRTFAQMSREEKNFLSHRGRALQKLSEYLRG